MASETYPLHRCVFRNDSYALKELLKNEEIRKKINECDNHNNTPLHLALMLGNVECVLPLINSGCDIVSSNTYGWNPVEEATMLGNKEIIQRLSITKLTKFIDEFYGKNSPLEQWNAILPNAHLKFRLKFKSPVPVLADMCPKDTLEVFKCGNCFRINTSVTGVTTNGIPKVIKGKHSFVCQIDNEKGICKAYLMDCLKKKYQELYPNLPEWCIRNITKHNTDVSSVYQFLFDFTSLTVKQKKGNLLKKGKKTLHIDRNKSYKADVFKLKGLKTDVRKRCKESVIGPYKSDIKTKVLKVESTVGQRRNSVQSNTSSNSDENIQSVFQKIGDDILKVNKNSGHAIPNNKEYRINDDDDDSESEDESDISDNELPTLPDNENESNNHVSILEKYIKHADDPNDYNSETDKHLIDMITRGYDDDNHVITKEDVQSLRKKYPKYLKNFLLSNIEKNTFKTLEKLESSDINGKVSQDGKTIVYEVNDAIEDTLDWDDVYDKKHSKEEEEEKAKLQCQKKMNSNRMKDFDFEKNKLTEKDYFDPSQTENLHVGRIFDVNEEKKSFDNSIKIWMTRDNEFPITLNHIKPLLSYFYFLFFNQMNVMGEGGKNKDKKIVDIFDALHSDKRYPIKFEIPILPVLKFQLKTIECNLDPKVIPEGIFDVPKNYEPGEVYLEKKTK
ncbi:hypothetical protein BCR32DRAFT_290661 [Anaeromyces robustus]|uniref:Uncharacterized protein n=1 Tax=Anaeromyces robustus TaxID=1754192 RepID=A0A1Y1XID1_9FUNG|nr:hypothetical protein BCR32DRAFT_290661 [Anaeromyces robustus]|eukprot:ORX85462.1 hypothetical protein BCR32DRAFT_290661 [Anaeromyces robustus]